MREENGYYVDSANNRWRANYYTLAEAERASESLVNCNNCTDCKSCVNCKSCVDCNYCKNCGYCVDCSGCKSCTQCSSCNNCENCVYCDDCNSCNNCNYCSHCVGFEENPQRVVGPMIRPNSANPVVYWVTPGDEQCIVGRRVIGTLNELEVWVKKIQDANNHKYTDAYLAFIAAVRVSQAVVARLD